MAIRERPERFSPEKRRGSGTEEAFVRRSGSGGVPGPGPPESIPAGAVPPGTCALPEAPDRLAMEKERERKSVREPAGNPVSRPPQERPGRSLLFPWPDPDADGTVSSGTKAGVPRPGSFSSERTWRPNPYRERTDPRQERISPLGAKPKEEWTWPHTFPRGAREILSRSSAEPAGWPGPRKCERRRSDPHSA